MFDLFKKDKEKTPTDVKGIRDHLLHFVKEQLGKAEGGEGPNIKGIHLFIACNDEEKQLYESAIYFEETDRFKEEVQKIADDFAIGLPHNWTMEITFADTLPAEATKVTNLDAALFIQTRKSTIQKKGTAYLSVLNGEAEKELYTIESTGGKINIGREKKVQTGDGFFRINAIAFPGESKNESNKFISRQHAHIEWDGEKGCFLLFADEGGVPPRNKIKVRSGEDLPVKLGSTKIGYELKDGDQILLGETALLEFSFSRDES